MASFVFLIYGQISLDNGLIEKALSDYIKHARYFLIFSLLALASCGDGMSKQDREFFYKIMEQYKTQGQYFIVSDVHSGDWTEVCLTPKGISAGDVLDDIRRVRKIKKDDITIINGDKSDTLYSDDTGEWGIYFFYGLNRIEYFGMRDSRMELGIVFSSDNNCLKKDEEPLFDVNQGVINKKVLALSIQPYKRLKKKYNLK